MLIKRLGYRSRSDGETGFPDEGDGVDGDIVDPRGEWSDDDPLVERAGRFNHLWSRLPLRAGLALVALGLVTTVVGSASSDSTGASASLDPTSGYPWCQDPASDFLGDPIGDGYGWENSRSCRVRPGSEVTRPTGSTSAPTSAPTSVPLDAVGPPTTAFESDRALPAPGPTGPSSTTTSASDPTSTSASDPNPDPTSDPAGGHDHGTGGHDHPTIEPPPGGSDTDYEANLALIRAQRVRNRNHDDSPYRDTPSAELVPENHYGPRSDYLGNPGGNPEQSFPVANGGQFRAGCEFSHFSYDDPLVYPNQPGAAHLHMYFGNTDANAYSTAQSILDSGSSTCNGQELNRTAYWAPAMFDGQGNVRIPERIVVYYKGEGLARGNAEPFPPGAAMIASVDLNTVDSGSGGAAGKFSYTCSENYSGQSSPAANTIPACDGSRFLNLYGSTEDPHVVLEMNVKFPQCWNGQDPSDPANYRHPASGSWYYSQCDGEFGHTLVNLEYFINYRVDIGESTADWYLSSDVDHRHRTLSVAGGSSIHADWWGGWHTETNQLFLDNCVNYRSGAASGCGFGYLTDGGPNGAAPIAGPALRYRPQYTGPTKVPALELYRELCPSGGDPVSATAAAYCRPG